VLEALAVLRKIGWRSVASFDDRRRLIEALRVAWRDRLKHLGDPEQADVPTQRLLSEEHIASLADEVTRAIETGKPVSAGTDGRPAGGTVHLSAADSRGNFAALTLTHGGSFGAGVTVPGLGLILGHGMSRFEPTPEHPNSPGPGKRPLHNMCPTIVERDGRPIAALGGRGGRKIVNSVCGVLARVAGAGSSFADALAAPRAHTEGDLALILEKSWPAEDTSQLTSIGYRVNTGPHATVSAVWQDASGAMESASR
jgi:gamma-glutamyltranspeptidase/glutathione hydrolase